MFIVVNYGDKKKALFNPNCKTNLLLENIKDRCQYSRDLEIDLSDDCGNLKNLLQSGCQYANEVLTTERENLVLIEVRRNYKNNKNGDVINGYARLSVPPPLSDADVTYIPLLNDEGIINAKFTARLTCRGSPSVSEGKLRKDKKKLNRRSTEAASMSSERNSLDTSMTSQSLTSLMSSGKRNGSGKGKKSNVNANGRGSPRDTSRAKGRRNSEQRRASKVA